MAVASKAWERVVWGNGEMQNSAKLDLIDSCKKRELGATLRIETRNETRDIHEMQCNTIHYNAMQCNAMQWHSPTLEKTLCHAPFLAYGVLGRSPCHPAV